MWRKVIVATVVLSVVGVVSAEAAVFCEKKSGAVFMRTACKNKEMQVDLATLGAVGPTGDKGGPGPTGPAGPAGPTGPSTGAAGGVLSGSYPNPTFAAGAIAPNAAELGGIAPSGFMQGTGHITFRDNTLHQSQEFPFPMAPLGSLDVVVDCFDANVSNGVRALLENYTGSSVTVWSETGGSAPTERSLASGGGDFLFGPTSTAGSAGRVTWYALPPSGPVTITVWTAADPSGMTCPYAAEVISGF